jgi:hypothetical protein
VPAGFAIGAPADFVLLRADPRVDIRNTRQVYVLRGRLLTGSSGCGDLYNRLTQMGDDEIKAFSGAGLPTS